MKDEESIYILEKGNLHEAIDLMKKGESEKVLIQIKVCLKKN